MFMARCHSTIMIISSRRVSRGRRYSQCGIPINRWNLLPC
jgi:hypothetical protein